MDTQKRFTLKTMAAGSLAAGLSTLPFATRARSVSATPDASSLIGDQLAHIKVSTVHSPFTNDLALRVTNTGAHDAVVTQITPLTFSTPRGQFNLGKLLENGPVRLAPGESRDLLLQQHAPALDPVSIGVGQPLTKLAGQISIVTDHQAYAAVTVTT